MACITLAQVVAEEGGRFPSGDGSIPLDDFERQAKIPAVLRCASCDSTFVASPERPVANDDGDDWLYCSPECAGMTDEEWATVIAESKAKYPEQWT